MKKTKTTLLISTIFFGLFFVFTKMAHAELINNFDVDIKINPDSSILVKEIIKYDFGENERHGIYRNIPVSNDKKSDTNKSIVLDIKSITVDGKNEEYKVSHTSSDESIQIGKSDVLVKGEHIYEITYVVKGSVNYFKDFDELYWNITGNYWKMPINNVKTTIELPPSVDMSKNKFSCYVGVVGSKESCAIDIVGNSIVSLSPRILQPNEGITIAVSFPKGTVYEPTKTDKIKSIILGNLILVLPILVFGIMFLVWKKYGKDPKGYSTIIAQYEPPKDMKPTLVGSLVDERADFNDITAGLIYLAEQGFIKIKKIEKTWVFSADDYEIELLKNDASNLEKIEKDILELFFSGLKQGEIIKISDFKKDLSFRSNVQVVMNNIYKEMTVRGFYDKNPNYAKLPYLITPFLLAPILIIVFGFNNSISIISIIVSCGIVFVFGFFMGKKTKLGAETKDYILGFKDFLSVTEKDRLNFHNAPDKTPEQFMKFLPYAIALGVEKKWAKQFEGIYLEQPSWYSGNVIGGFAAADFVSHMSGMSQSFNTAAGGQSGSGGGGASGGGGGGGGGGSW